jgi:hypothetical protein
VSFHLPRSALAFTADTLMAMGCGRLFEGDGGAAVSDSHLRLRALPPAPPSAPGTNTPLDARFALSIDGANAALGRAEANPADPRAREPTVPSNLGEEIATNPFLRADDPVLSQRWDAGCLRRGCLRAIRSAKDGFADAPPAAFAPRQATFAKARGTQDFPPAFPASDGVRASTWGNTRLPTHGNVIGLPEKTA